MGHEHYTDGVQERNYIEELDRMVRSLADASSMLQQVAHDNGPSEVRPNPTLHAINELKFRRRRDAAFIEISGTKGLFGEPAWDMLLDLFVAQRQRKRISVSSLCIAAAVPATTALRWIRLMEKLGLIRRVPDHTDRRKIYVELTASTESTMSELLDQKGKE